MPKLYILCGPSGCGKTTWAANFIKEHRDTDDIRYVSRDEIRFELIDPNKEYFSREKEVFRRFTGYLTQTLVDGFDVIADATHLNEFSRRKLTHAIDIYFKDYEIVYVSFNVNVDVCIEHNAKRTGRANVPEAVIRNMCKDFKAPSLDEDERAINIMEVS
jgi:predicted kinase